MSKVVELTSLASGVNTDIMVMARGGKLLMF